MSIRSLFGTTISSTESAVKGVVSLGSVVGDATTYIKRHASRINSASTIELEETEHEMAIASRQEALVKRAKEMGISDVREEYKLLREILLSK